MAIDFIGLSELDDLDLLKDKYTSEQKGHSPDKFANDIGVGVFMFLFYLC